MQKEPRTLNKANYAAGILLAGTLVLVLAGILATFYEEQAYRLQKIDELTVQGQILAASVTAALAFDDNAAAQEYIEALQANPELEAAGVYDTNGTLFAQIARKGAQALAQRIEIHAPYILDDRIIVTLPVQQDGQVEGSVYLRAILNPFARRLLRYSGIALLVAMALIVVAVFAVAQRALTRANARLEGQAEQLVAINQRLEAEIAEREKTEEVLRQTQKMEALGQLSGGIAHDFNNLLAIIRGNLQLLQRRIAQGRPDVGRYAVAANEALSRAANLTQRILAFARRQPLSAAAVDVSKLLDGLKDMLRHSLGEGVRIELNLNADWLTWCDAQQMENVILNLAINARDAMPGGGVFTIETANHRELDATSAVPPGDYLRLVVRDTGTGMTDEVKRKAIDPFFTTKLPGRGTGLGLSMTFGYVQQSNGIFRIDSAPGKGTSIIILLPRYQVPASASAK